jgi:hypothetical protein
MNYYPPQWFEEMREECMDAVKDDLWPTPWKMFECVIPAELCPPGNARDSMHWRDAHRIKKRLRSILNNRYIANLPGWPLPGRPIVHLIRFTPRRVDPRSNWDKFPVDMLTPYREVPVKGKRPRRFGCLGIIADDSGDHIDLRAEWRKSSLGVVYVRVFASP